MTDVHPLKNYREQLGLTQDALAKELGVSSITVSRWETGARKIDQDLLPHVSGKTGIAPEELRPDLARLMKPAEAPQ